MCESIHEGGRRCPNCDSPQARQLAALNRKKSRNQRRSMALLAQDRMGRDGKRAFMAARPRELSLIVSHISSFDSNFANELYETAGGDLPGTHNMVMSEARSGAVEQDYDKRGTRKTDPKMVSQAMEAITGVESAYVNSDKAREDLSENQLNELRRSARIRAEAAELGLYNPSLTPESMSPEQLRFYHRNSPDQVAKLGEIENTVERQFEEYALNNVTFTPRRRGYVTGEQNVRKTPAELADTDLFKKEGYFPIREGVDLRRNPNYTGDEDSLEPEFIYRVDDKIDLPANGARAAVGETSKILDVESIGYDPATAPQGQTSLYGRLLSPDTPSGQRTREKITEDLIRAGYFGQKTPGVDTRVDVSAEEAARRGGRRPGEHPLSAVFGTRQVARPGKSKRITHDTLVATAQSTGMSISERGEKFSEIGYDQLQSLDNVEKRMARVRLHHFGIEENSTVSGVPYPKARNKSERKVSSFVTTADGRRKEHRKVMEGLKQVSESHPTVPKNTAKLTPSELARTSLARPNQTLNSADVDNFVARANASLAATNPDSADTKTLAAGSRLKRLVTRDQTQRKVNAKKNPESVGDPVTVTSRAVLPKSTNASHDFVVGRSFTPTEYVAAHAGTGTPSMKSAHERTVRVVYTTNQATAVTSDRAVVGPDNRFRILRTDTSNPNEVVVHVVDEDMALEATS